MSITIFEGPDCCGKTTLIEEFKKRGLIDEVIHHGSYSTEDLADVYLESMLRYGPEVNVALDRAWPSEEVYCQVMRGGHNRITAPQRRMLERVAMSRSGLTILCLPSFESSVKVFLERLDEEYLDDTTQLESIHGLYGKLAARPTMQTMVYDWEKHTIDNLLNNIKFVRSPTNLGPGIGRWQPEASILLIGDRVNPSQSKHDLPFVSWQGSSVWLAEQLEKHGINEGRLYWVNTYCQGSDNPALSAEFIKDLKPQKVIALGSNATQWCVDNSIIHIKVNHPQYHKRFHHDEPYQLIKEIKNV